MKRTFPAVIFVGILFLSGCGEHPADFDSLSKAAMAAYNKADYNEAVHLIGKALHEKPSDYDMLYHMGMSFAKLDLIDSALTYFHRANVLYPGDRVINEELFRYCTAIEDYDCALSAVQILVATGDSEEMFWIPLADLNFFLGKYQVAEKYYKLLINDKPREARYYWNLSESLSMLNKPKEAIDVLKSALDELGPNPVAYAQVAINYVTLREHAQAEKYFRKAVELDPKNVSLWINLANVLTEQDSREKKEEGLQIYKMYYIDTPEVFKLDSLIKALEKELGEK